MTLSAVVACGEGISTKVLNPSNAMPIALSRNFATTILFPSVPAGSFGLGLVVGGKGGSGSVHLEHPEGSQLMVLHALSDDAAVTMTVLMDGQLYVFQLHGSMNPDIAVTLLKEENPGYAPKALQVSAEEVKASRPKYDPELFIGLERRARDAALLRKLYPDLYDGYKTRSANYFAEGATVKTTVTQIHRFSKEDAVVLEGTIRNETSHPISFDGRLTSVQVANQMHPAKLTDCVRPIPAGETVPIIVVLEGDLDGARANLSIENEYRIILPPIPGEGTVWNFKNGDASGKSFKVATPNTERRIPLSQTGNPVKDP